MNPENQQEKNEIAAELKKFNCIPAFIDNQTMEKFIRFNEVTIRPLFHNFKGLGDFEFEMGKRDNWNVYRKVNEELANMVTEQLKDNVLVWVHDTYLLLVPTFVRRKDVNANVGFSMHSPFPSSDIFKMFPYREELLKSLICCDLIGFHIFEYAR